MQRFKSIILPMQGKNKSNLHWLYNTATDIELTKIFSFDDITQSFGYINYYRNSK